MEGEICKILMEVPLPQEVVLCLIITYIHWNKQLIFFDRGLLCSGEGKKSFYLDQEYLLKLYSDWRETG